MFPLGSLFFLPVIHSTALVAAPRYKAREYGGYFRPGDNTGRLQKVPWFAVKNICRYSPIDGIICPGGHFAAVVIIYTHSYNTRSCGAAVFSGYRKNGCTRGMNRHKPMFIHGSYYRIGTAPGHRLVGSVNGLHICGDGQSNSHGWYTIGRWSDSGSPR